jgi:hypothetical protein
LDFDRASADTGVIGTRAQQTGASAPALTGDIDATRIAQCFDGS